MTVINTFALQNESVLTMYADKDRIDLEPPYQRQGDIWSREKRQLLIDSIINRYDIPKLYFHKLEREVAKKTKKDYAVIDGRQRLETIFGFINGEFTLSKDFEFLEDETVTASELTYSDLALKYPRLKQRFDAFTLPIICVETEDLELIEDMFSRLNEAVPLNASEKRNAIGGDMAKAITKLSGHALFTKKVRFSNGRYQHREVAARLLYLEYSVRQGKVIDTKKPFLDQFTRDFKSNKKKAVESILDSAEKTLDDLLPLFVARDPLLAAQAGIPIYFLLARDAKAANKLNKITRKDLINFQNERAKNKTIAATDITKAIFDLLEYDRLSQQGTNDASSIRERLRILKEYLHI
ncbi:DUF262 domain-containing protein [Sideroxydans sp. CL21]|uniref:DUF262 domain-containing protein n=1 Tax=Sideroxydans sp. CL21 TaxID=2600596 RepID=UPI0024BD33AE|nr:DUF262 domain-containing protein [Sideroxydans sp. CL21]